VLDVGKVDAVAVQGKIEFISLKMNVFHLVCPAVRRLPQLGALRAFEAAARHLSFKKAAHELGLTPTAISHQVRLLEEYCGEKLFRRRPRPLALSDAGASLFPTIRDGFDAFAAALSSLGTYVGTKPLRVTTTNAFASRWLVPRLNLWREVHEEVTLSIIGADRVMRLDADEADLAIRYARSAPRGGSREIFRDRFYPVCSSKLLAKCPTIRCAADLSGYPLIHFDWFANDRTAPNWERWFEIASGADPPTRQAYSISLSFREELHAIEAVLAGQGIALCSDIVVADDLASGALVKVLDLALPGYGFYPVYTFDHPRRAVIEIFVKWISTVAQGSVEARPLIARVSGE
jgi:LysR family transcriptional regulator, glycine cleavage system transcriptional activator